MSSEGKEPLPTLSGSTEKKSGEMKGTTIDLKAKEAEASGDVVYLNWREEIPIKVKKILWSVKENSAKLVPIDLYTSAVCIFLLAGSISWRMLFSHCLVLHFAPNFPASSMISVPVAQLASIIPGTTTSTPCHCIP